MRILFLSRLYYPHIGGVEKHVEFLSRELIKRGHIVELITERFNPSLKRIERIHGVVVHRFSYPKVPFLGLLFIWYFLFRNHSLIREADLVHCHDVFIWYFPFRFIFPKKRVYTTFHGLEWDSPLSKTSILQKRLTFYLSSGTIGVGRFLEKYLKIRFNYITYGATDTSGGKLVKKKNRIVYVGRLEENTGLIEFLRWLNANKRYKVDFCGDGRLRKVCIKYGVVHGFCDPTLFLKIGEYCVPGGYLAALEALSYKCKLKIFWNNQVKKNYWKMSPFFHEDLYLWVKEQTWENLADLYIKLWQL